MQRQTYISYGNYSDTINHNHPNHNPMTNHMERSKEWLVEQIKAGIHGYMEVEKENIMDIVSHFILESMIRTACDEHAKNHIEEDGELLIRIRIPIPKDCRLILDDPAIMKEILEE